MYLFCYSPKAWQACFRLTCMVRLRPRAPRLALRKTKTISDSTATSIPVMPLCQSCARVSRSLVSGSVRLRGETSNTWIGKRALLREQGFGFVVLYRGREERELKAAADAETKGQSDARDGATNAQREGFSPGTIVFLDIEEGGRLSPAYHAYLRAWADTLIAAGYRPGVYCSAMAVHEGKGVTITTADDIRSNEAPREFSYWVYNDGCPPAPGCVTKLPPRPSRSGIPYAAVWQFAQSPRRKAFTTKCAATYAHDGTHDGNCYAPGDSAHAWFLDLNTANSADPSGGAK